MSVQSWKREFTPREASTAKDTEDALRMSLLKWTGLTAYGLSKHGIHMEGTAPTDQAGYRIELGSNTCALCQVNPCETCPLVRCSEANSTYGIYLKKGDPWPMLGKLRKALDDWLALEIIS